MEKTIVYTYKKSTKSTYVFESAEAGVYYLNQSLFVGQPPATITVTIKG